MAKIKRSLVKSFLNTGTLGTPIWSLIGEGVTSAKIEYNPKTSEEIYIHQDNATISVESYAPTMPVEMSAVAGDAAFEFIDTKRIGRNTLSDVEAEILNVWLYKTPALGFYLAERQAVSLQVDDIGGEGGESAKLNYTVNYNGEPARGEYNPTLDTFMASPINTILTTMVIGTVTLTPLFATDKRWLHYAGSVPNATTQVTMTSTLTGATIVQKVDGVTVNQGANAALDVGVNHLTIQVTVGTETVTYYIDITRLAA